MADTANPTSIFATLLAIGVAPVVGMFIGGGWVAAVFFVAAASLVTARAFKKHARSMADRDVLDAALTPTQAIGMLSALRGKPLAGSAHAKVEDLAKLADTDPVTAHARVCEMLVESPRNVPALALCARLAFDLQHTDASARWATALRIAIDQGLNRVAAATFVAHREHRDALELSPSHRNALAHALLANGHADDARWARPSAATRSI
jgi:hypothetical protein